MSYITEGKTLLTLIITISVHLWMNAKWRLGTLVCMRWLIIKIMCLGFQLEEHFIWSSNDHSMEYECF